MTVAVCRVVFVVSRPKVRSSGLLAIWQPNNSLSGGHTGVHAEWEARVVFAVPQLSLQTELGFGLGESEVFPGSFLSERPTNPFQGTGEVPWVGSIVYEVLLLMLRRTTSCLLSMWATVNYLRHGNCHHCCVSGCHCGFAPLLHAVSLMAVTFTERVVSSFVDSQRFSFVRTSTRTAVDVLGSRVLAESTATRLATIEELAWMILL